jgi:signal transduction histidine kinase
MCPVSNRSRRAKSKRVRAKAMTTNASGASSIPANTGSQNNRPPPDRESGIAASLAHEINNPVEALWSLLYLLEAKVPLAEEGHQYLALAREEIKRISQILHKAMDDFRNTQGPEETNVPELLRSVLEFYRSRFVTRHFGRCKLL